MSKHKPALQNAATNSVSPDVSELERRAKTGSRSAFGEFIRQHDHELRGVVWTMLESSDDTDDVMQVAYLKAFRAIGSFDGRSSLKTWLHSICYRSALDHLRHASIRRHETLTSVTGEPATTSTESSALLRVRIDEVLSSLDPEERAMFILIAGFGYSYDETALIVNRRRGTVASTVSRVRKRLAREQEI